MAKKRKSGNSKGKGNSRRPENRQDGNDFVFPIDEAAEFDDIAEHPEIVDEVMDFLNNADPLDASYRLIMAAHESNDPEERVGLAQAALAICDDCVDAYVILSNFEEEIGDAIDLLREAVAAGERILPKGLDAYEGKWWQAIETRPYMNACVCLGRAFWEAEAVDDAIEEFTSLIERDPKDHLQARHDLATIYLELHLDRSLDALFAQFQDDSSGRFMFSRALHTFRQQGDSEEACACVEDGMADNELIAWYLLGYKNLPGPTVGLEFSDDEDEAIAYTVQNMKAWRTTSGALSWLRKLAGNPPEWVMESELPAAPTWDVIKSKLEFVDQEEEAHWQFALRKFDDPVIVDDSEVDLTMCVLLDTTEGILFVDLFEEQLTLDDLWEILIDTMRKTPEFADSPFRPGVIEVDDERLAKTWKSKLQDINVDIELLDRLDIVEEMSAELMDRFSNFVGRLSETEVPEDITELFDYPQYESSEWEADIVHLPSRVTTDDGLVRPYSIMVLERNGDYVLSNSLVTDEPITYDLLLNKIKEAVMTPLAGDSHRPGRIYVRSEQVYDVIAADLKEIDVECVIDPELTTLDDVTEQLVNHMFGEESIYALSESPGVSRELMQAYFEAANGFYNAAPWDTAPPDEVFVINCKEIESGPWYAVVMGQSGVSMGLALYDDPDNLKACLEGQMSDDEATRSMSAKSVLFSEEFEMHGKDLDLAASQGWPIAGPEAFPSAMRVNPGGTFRALLKWEIELLTACMWLFPIAIQSDQPVVDQSVDCGERSLTVSIESIF